MSAAWGHESNRTHAGRNEQLAVFGEERKITLSLHTRAKNVEMSPVPECERWSAGQNGKMPHFRGAGEIHEDIAPEDKLDLNH